MRWEQHKSPPRRVCAAAAASHPASSHTWYTVRIHSSIEKAQTDLQPLACFHLACRVSLVLSCFSSSCSREAAANCSNSAMPFLQHVGPPQCDYNTACTALDCAQQSAPSTAVFSDVLNTSHRLAQAWKLTVQAWVTTLLPLPLLSMKELPGMESLRGRRTLQRQGRRHQQMRGCRALADKLLKIHASSYR